MRDGESIQENPRGKVEKIRRDMLVEKGFRGPVRSAFVGKMLAQ